MTDYSIFFIIAVVATGVGALLFLLSLFGLGEHDLDFDADSADPKSWESSPQMIIKI